MSDSSSSPPSFSQLMNRENTLQFQIALTLVAGVGPARARSLVAFCGSPEAVFREKKSALMRIPDIGEVTANSILKSDVMERAEREVEFVVKHQIDTCFFHDKNFPSRLKECDDAPALLFSKGKMNLNADRIISVVGTRKASSYGKQFCEELIRDLKPFDPVVVSGLAYGIDVCAHRSALNEKLETVACLAHGLDRIYPPLHRPVAQEMIVHGGLVTEFISGTQPDRELFPMRNRVIAGLSDCTIVLESDVKGGSILTAYIAESYGRNVFALPGRTTDKYSAGTNSLIRKGLAHLITSADDLVDIMQWDASRKEKPKQMALFNDLTETETLVMNTLREKGKLALDLLSDSTGLAGSKVSAMLLELEFKGLVKSFPGKIYSEA